MSADPRVARPRILCLDPEGGHGGSSRSLYESLRHIDPAAMAIAVWCRRPGPIQDRYAALGHAVRVEPAMPTATAVPRLSRNLAMFGRARLRWPRSRGFREALRRAADEDFDLIHFNHEGLFQLARWLRPRCRVPLTMHFRKTTADTPFLSWQLRTAGRAIDHAIFITENEESRFRKRDPHCPGTVVYNIADVPPDPGAVARHPDLPDDGRFTVACLSNFSHQRGVDRLVEVAEVLAVRGRHDIRFAVAGDMRLPRSLPGPIAPVARAGGTLADHAAQRGVAGFFTFLGHVDRPEQVLAASQALIKPARDNIPWGRDVLEALGMGRPVLATGTFARFVEPGVTGFLCEPYSAETIAGQIVALADAPETAARMGTAGRARIAELCDGPRRAAELAAIWRRLAHEGRRPRIPAA